MRLGEIARDMRERMPWDVARRVLAAHDIPRALGWDNTLERLNNADKSLDRLADGLSWSLQEHYVCGEKMSRFYALSAREMKALRGAVANAKTPKNAFSDAFPRLVDGAAMDREFEKKPVLASIVHANGGTALVFGSARAVYVRETLDPKTLPDGLGTKLSGYDEIVGVKLIKFQAMDVVWVPNNGTLVDVRIDYPRGMHQDQALVAQEQARGALHKLYGDGLLTNAVNLFPLMNAMYKAQNEGCVVELGFGTTTASIKHEKMRRAHSCLRDEKYHKGGKAALKTDIEPYRLSIEYSVKIGDVTTLPELSFHGTSRLAGATSPKMQEVTIRKCAGLTDYEFVRSRLDHYLTLTSKS